MPACWMTRSCSRSTAAYFDLTGGLERWLYRLVRKHGGRQEAAGASILCISTPSPAASRRSSILPTTCARSSVARHCRATNSSSTRDPNGAERLDFAPIAGRSVDGSVCASAVSCRTGGKPVNQLVLSGTATLVPSGTRSSCYRGPKSELKRLVCSAACRGP